MQKIWDLDRCARVNNDCKNYMKKMGYDQNTHERFSVGQKVEFLTGYDRSLLVTATIKGINNADIYVFNDCYWFPIQDTRILK